MTKVALKSFDQSTKLLIRSSGIPNFLEAASKLSQKLSLNPYLAKILVCRGILEESEVKGFIAPSLKDNLPDPSDIKGISEAAVLVRSFVESKERITVFTDFDVDGLSSGAQLALFLKQCGASVGCYTPSRFTEGYGLSISAVEKIAAAGSKLLICVDCGISNSREISRARELGLKTIILDHHLPHELPPADAIVDPAQEDCPFNKYQLAAAGLVWMFLIVLRKELSSSPACQGLSLPSPKDFLDLAALGTICDMVPLKGPNRLIAFRGLEALERTERPGLIALKNICGVKPGRRFGSGQVGFMLGPRMNAAGRVGEGSQVMELLTTESSQQASVLAKRIDRQNSERQALEKEGLEKSLALIAEQEEKTGQVHAGLAVFDKSFHLGVIGIIAQRLVEQFYKPALVMAPGEVSIGKKVLPVIKGSVRSITGFSVAKNLEQLSEYLLNFGGHEAAGGFSLEPEKLEPFCNAFYELVNNCLDQEQLTRMQKVDIEVPLSALDYEFVDTLQTLEPFGLGNPAPVFLSSNIEVESVKTLANNHLKLRLSSNQKSVGAVAWKFAGHPLLVKGSKISAAYSPEINRWNGVSSVQLNLKEVWPCETQSN